MTPQLTKKPKKTIKVRIRIKGYNERGHTHATEKEAIEAARWGRGKPMNENDLESRNVGCLTRRIKKKKKKIFEKPEENLRAEGPVMSSRSRGDGRARKHQKSGRLDIKKKRRKMGRSKSHRREKKSQVFILRKR